MNDKDDHLRMYITSYGEELSGNNTLVKIRWGNSREESFLLDCGLFQEGLYDKRNLKFDYKPENLSFIVLLHDHTDHIGRLPYIIKCGSKGPIYCPYEAVMMASNVLSESADRLRDEHILVIKREMAKARRQKLKDNTIGKRDKVKNLGDKKKSTNALYKPDDLKLIYSAKDIKPVLNHMVPVEYKEAFYPCKGLEITMYRNAHLASGAAIVVCHAYYKNEHQYVLFTGDLALKNQLTDYSTYIPKKVAERITCVVSESTYGASNITRPIETDNKILEDELRKMCKKGSTIFIISNSLERPQVVLRDIKKISKNILKEEMKNVPIYLDTTYGIVCHEMYKDILGISKKYLPKNFVTISKESRDSLIYKPGPKIVICTSPKFYKGSFCEYAPIALPDPNTTIIFASYVSKNIQNIIESPRGNKISYNGSKIAKNCNMLRLSKYSAHATLEELDEFMSWFPNLNTVLFNHGSTSARQNCVLRYENENRHCFDMQTGKTFMVVEEGIKKIF